MGTKDLEILKTSFKDIIEIIRKYNDDLQHGNISSVQTEISKIFLSNFNYFKSNFNLVESTIDGLNLQVEAVVSPFLFPKVLYINNFRMQIINKIEKRLEKSIDFKILPEFIAKEIIKTIDSKRGGFSEKTLELLRFYVQTFKNVLDNSLDKFKPYFSNYLPKYVKITQENLNKNFYLTNKYIRMKFIPNCEYQNLNAVLIDYSKFENIPENLQSKELGLIYDNDYQKKFLIGYISNNERKREDSCLIRKISFFENLDLYYKNKKYPVLRNGLKNIFELYCDYKETNFVNTATEFDTDFSYKMRKFDNAEMDNETLIHIYNTRKLLLDFEAHPVLKNIFRYRIKLVTLYSSINYFIHIYDPKRKNLEQYWQLLDILLKNTFANGFIIHYKTGLLLSTNAFKKEFEKIKKEFLDFIWSFKLECKIYEDLNFIPFSFYHLPNSQYYSNDTNSWSFPEFEDKPVSEYYDHLAVNYKQEIKRLEDTAFKTRVDQTVERLNREITEIKNQQEQHQKVNI